MENLKMNDMIGHNNPPASFETTTQAIQDLFDEAANWLDGEPLETAEQHDTLIKLVKDLRAAKRDADNARKEEAKPFDEGKKAVQDKYNPFVKPKTGLADMAIATAQKVLVPYMGKLEAERLAKVEASRKEAEELAAIAQNKMQQSAGNLQDRQFAEIAVKDAKHASSKANKMAKQNTVSGARTKWDVELVDSTAAMRALWVAHKPRFEALMTTIAQEQVRAGTHLIDGFIVTSRKVV